MEVIAEVANSHEGNYKIAYKTAIEAIKSKANSVKFQIYFAEELLSKKHKRYEHFKSQSFNSNQWKWIFDKIKKKTPTTNIYADIFGLKALNIAKKNKLDGIKIHSSDLSNTKLLNELKKYKKKFFYHVVVVNFMKFIMQ